jgi:heme/copper-type cytochrome/quinol oxidase subunit 3
LRTINKLLAGGLIIANIFLVTFIVLAYTKTADGEKNKFVNLEIASWLLGSCSAAILIMSTLYTSWVLKRLYGEDFERTYMCIFLIVVIFCVSFATRTVYEWVMYSKYRIGESP